MTDHSAVSFWITMAWLLLSFHGGVMTAVALRDGVRDLGWLHQKDLNGPRTIVAVANIRNTAARLLLFVVFFLLGINAVVGPTAPLVTLRAVVTSSLLILVLLVKVLATHMDARDGARLLTEVKISRARAEAAAEAAS